MTRPPSALVFILSVLLASVFLAQAQARWDDKSLEAVREAEGMLSELGYLTGAKAGKWSERLSGDARRFMKDHAADPSVNNYDADLVLLRAALRRELMRSGPQALNLFVASDAQAKYRQQAMISTDGRIGLTQNQNAVLLWDLGKAKQIAQLRNECCIAAADLSRDGRFAAYATSDGLFVWNLTTGRLIARLERPKFSGDTTDRAITHVRFLPSATGLLIADERGGLSQFVFDRGVYELIGEHLSDVRDPEIYGNTLAMDVSGDGQLAATFNGYDGKLKIWNIDRRSLLRTVSLFKGTTSSSERGELIDIGDKLLAFDAFAKSLTLYTRAKGKYSGLLLRIGVADGSVTTIERSNIKSFAVSPARDVVAFASGYDIEVLSLDDMTSIQSRASADLIRAIASGGSSAIVNTGDGQLAVADLNQQNVTSIANENQLQIPGFALNEAKRRIELGNPEGNFLRMSLDTGVVERAGSSNARLASFVLDRDGRLVDTGDAFPKENDGEISKVDPETGFSIQTQVSRSSIIKSGFTSVVRAVAPSGNLVASSFENENTGIRNVYGVDNNKPIADAYVSILDSSTGRQIQTFSLSPFTKDPQGLMDRCQPPKCSRTLTGKLLEGSRAIFTFSGTGRYLYAGYKEPIFSAYDPTTGKRIRTYGTSLDFLKYMPDAKVGPVAGKDGWDFPTAARVARANSTPSAIVPIPNSDDFFAILNGGIGLNSFMLKFQSESSNFARIVKIPAATDTAVTTADGSKVALAYDGGSLILVDTAGQGRVVAELNGHDGKPTDLQFTSDGTRLISRATDGTVRVWDATVGEALTTTYIFANGEWLTITPEGFFAASDRGASALLLRRAMSEVFLIEQFYQALYRPDLVREKLAGDPRGLVREAKANLDLNKVLSSGSAPEVKISLPGRAPGTTAVDTSSVSVDADIIDRGGGVGRVEWRVNGITVGVDTAPTSSGVGQSLRLSRNLVLGSGNNAIEIVAYNNANYVASVPARVTVAAAQGAVPGDIEKTPQRLFVLAAGLDKYADQRFQLQYSVQDAKAMAQAFVDSGKGLYESVEVKVLSDTEVTKDKLEAAFQELSKKIRRDDVFVLYLAGHGKTVDGRYYFVPQTFKIGSELSKASINTAVTAQGISQEQWQRWLALVSATKSVILFDTCESGTLTGDEGLTKSLEQGAANDRLAQATGRSIMTASSGSTEAFEGFRGHGLFTYNLLDALGRGDGDGNGTIEVTELAAFVYSQVRSTSERVFKQRQEPQIKINLNYPLAKQTRVLQGDPPLIAENTTPSFELRQEAQLQIKPSSGSTVVRSLLPKTAVTVLKSEGGWSLIASDGKALGYVATRDLAPAK